jgi:hypothetical protein
MPLLSNPEKNPPRPDLVLQSLDDTVGFCLELKWSLPDNEQLLRKEIADTAKYSQPRRGWKTSTGTISKVEAFIVAPRDVCARITNMAQTDDLTRQILQERLTLLSWDFSRTTGPERLYVLKVGGTHSSLDQLFVSPGLELAQSAMTDTFAKVMFYGAKPPPPYLMEKVYLLVNAIKAFEALNDVEIRARKTHYCKEGVISSAKELYTEQASFFQSWERADQEIPQLRQKWIQEALVGLSRIKLAIPVVPLRLLNRTGAIFLRAKKPWWEKNLSQLFFIPSRSRGFGLRHHIISSYANYLLRRTAQEM